MSFPYEDILRRPRPQSPRHAPLSQESRAAQFAPFAALNGHASAIQETARLTEDPVELAEDALQELNRQLQAIVQALPRRPAASFLCFQPDPRKPGGRYQWICGRVKKYDPAAGLLVLEDGREIPLEGIRAAEMEPEAGPQEEEGL